MEYREKIEQYIDSHRQEMINDICALCRINSEKMSYKEGMPYGEGAYHALEAALGMAEQYGFSINNYDNYVGTADLNDKEAQLDILAHLDVVPAGEGWKETEAFEPVEKDGLLFGRGTADDKGPAVAAMYAMRAVKELKLPLKKNVRLILGTDEECGSSDIAHYYAVEKEAPMTFSPDGSYPVVNIEKGRLAGNFTAEWTPDDKLPRIESVQAGIKENVVPGKAFAIVKGLDQEVLEAAMEAVEKETGVRFRLELNDNAMELTAIGSGAHASTPAEGNNALTGLLTLLDRLEFAPCEQTKMIHNLLTLFPHGDTRGEALGVAMADELSGELTMALSMMTITEKDLSGTFDSRSPICATDENMLETIRRNMKAAGMTLHNDSMTPPHHVDGNSHFVKTLLNVYEEYTGQKGECIAMGGGTYVHSLKNGVAFGASMPGTDNRMHGADEFAVIDELLMSAKMFAQVIVELCS